MTSTVRSPPSAVVRSTRDAVPTLTSPTVALPGIATANAPHPPTTTTTDAATLSLRHRTWLKVRTILGYAGGDRAARHNRRQIVSVVVFAVVAFAQIVIIATLTGFAAVLPSPRISAPGNTQLDACAILEAWNLVWLARLLVRCYINAWVLRLRRQRRRIRMARMQARIEAREAAAAATARPGVGNPTPTVVHPLETDSIIQPACPLTLVTFHILIYKLDPFFILIWFFSALLVIYTHGSCRDDAVLVSAATYSILTVIYVQFMIDRLVPIVRNAIQRRRDIQATPPKLTRAEVDRIPLVLYIPPPPDDFPASPSSSRPPSQALSYTLAPASANPKPKRRRFVPFRPRAARPRSVSDADADVEGGPNIDPWDQMWAAGPTPYPLVRLPENLATCGICLDGFQAPRRLNSSSSTQPPFSHADAFADELARDGCADEDEGAGTHEMREIRRGHGEEAEVAEVQVESPVATDARAVELAHEGGEDAPGPLRLLSCGHAYHKDCVDPWLTNQYGRCPYCSARVIVPPAPANKRWWRRSTV